MATADYSFHLTIPSSSFFKSQTTRSFRCLLIKLQPTSLTHASRFSKKIAIIANECSCHLRTIWGVTSFGVSLGFRGGFRFSFLPTLSLSSPTLHTSLSTHSLSSHVVATFRTFIFLPFPFAYKTPFLPFLWKLPPFSSFSLSNSPKFLAFFGEPPSVQLSLRSAFLCPTFLPIILRQIPPLVSPFSLILLFILALVSFLLRSYCLFIFFHRFWFFA